MEISKVWTREENPLIPLLERVLMCHSYRHVVKLLRRHHWVDRQAIYELRTLARINFYYPMYHEMFYYNFHNPGRWYPGRWYPGIAYSKYEKMERRQAFRINMPSSMMVVGPSGCGKTVFTTKLLLDNLDLFETPPTKIYYCYGAWQEGFRPMKKQGIKFHEGIPD